MLARRVKHGPIGLDIGSTGLKLLQLTLGGDRPEVVAAAVYDLPAGENADAREQAIRDALSEAVGRRAFRGRDVVTALGASEFQIKNVRLPRMPPEEMAGAVDFEAQDRFGLPPGSAQYRYAAAGEVRHGNELKEEVIVFAAREDLLRKRLALLESVKLRPAAMDAAPCAMARSFMRFLRRTEDASAVNVFVDVGWHATTVAITRGTDLSFLKMIDVGGSHLNAAVARAVGIAPPEAAALRVRIMTQTGGRRAGDAAVEAAPNDLRNAVADAVRPDIERLAREVQLCLRYFSVTFRGQRPECVTFVGGEAHEPLLLQSVGEGLEIPCTIGHPLRGIGGEVDAGGRDRRTYAPAWAVAAGLALRNTHWVTPFASAGKAPAVAAAAEVRERSPAA